MKEKLTPEVEDNITKFIFYTVQKICLSRFGAEKYNPKLIRRLPFHKKNFLKTYLKLTPEAYLRKAKKQYKENPYNGERGIIHQLRVEMERLGHDIEGVKEFLQYLYEQEATEQLVRAVTDTGTSLYEFEYDPEHEFFQEILYLKLQGVI